uniref:PNPLA domain-containing protein n=1 Tax=viral metagenome TaxID=1070528 RepID=A0A6C0EL87_9ZZZZ
MELYNDCVNNLLENLDKSDEITIDLVLDSGGFKGIYLYGALIYLKQLEENGYIKIDKISGSSIGAILGAFYILDKLDSFYDYYISIREHFRNDLNLSYIPILLTTIIKTCNKDDYKLLNNKLFINYYNITSKEEYIISTYNSNEEIIEYLKCTSYLPIITDGNLCYNSMVDGNKPYLFNNGHSNENSILYISLNSIGKITDYFNIIRDKNPSKRIIKAILDIHDFFLFKTPTKMCSFINKWSYRDFTIYRVKEFIWIYFLYSITIIDFLYKQMPISIKNSLIFNQVNNITVKFLRDMYIKTIFT